jgi:hypothetical protein
MLGPPALASRYTIVLNKLKSSRISCVFRAASPSLTPTHTAPCCMHVYVAAVCPAADGSELESVAPAGMVNVVARLEAFAGMSRMKRLALVVLCHTVTDKHMMRLKV